MLKKVLYSIGIAILLFSGIGLLLPRNVHVERQIEILRPAVTVFTVLNTYRTFRSWSPWVQRDPEAVYELSGPETGTGAGMSWRGDPRLVGSGYQEITESRPNALVRMRLNFEEQGSATSYFQIEESASGVLVTWGLDTDVLDGRSGPGGLLARYFGLFLDAWIGRDYETGLANLKAFVESMPSADFSDLDVEITNVQAQDILYVATAAGDGSSGSVSSLSAAYQEISDYMTENELDRAAQPLVITRFQGGQASSVEAAIPVVLQEVEPRGRIRIGRSPAGRALRAIHRGPYAGVADSYEKLGAWMAAHGVSQGQVFWEQYISNPGETAPADRITHLYVLLDHDQ